MFAHFGMIWADPKTKTEGQFLLRYLIEHADPGKSGVPFTKPEHMKRLLDVFVDSDFIGERWHIDLSRLTPAKHAEWQAARPPGATYFVPQYVKKTGKGKEVMVPAKEKVAPGHARFYLQHPRRKQSVGSTNSVKRSAATLRYVPHVLAIMAGLAEV